jgi:hypothetical protein
MTGAGRGGIAGKWRGDIKFKILCCLSGANVQHGVEQKKKFHISSCYYLCFSRYNLSFKQW